MGNVGRGVVHLGDKLAHKLRSVRLGNPVQEEVLELLLSDIVANVREVRTGQHFHSGDDKRF